MYGPASEIIKAVIRYTGNAVCLLTAVLSLAAPQALAAHAYAQFGDIRYPAGFQHFDWVNPDAPKGGEITLVTPFIISQYDKYNPFTLKGVAAPGLGAYIPPADSLIFESLMTASLDEPLTIYCLLADDIQVASDGLSVSFRINPLAHFQDGSPVLATDVKYSFDRLTSKEASPTLTNLYADIKSATVQSERTIRFDFRQANRSLPMLAGTMPVFSHKWGAGKKFDDVVMDKPIGSGPYRFGREVFGRDISYERDPEYWARDLPVRRGMYNFNRVNYRIYSDQIVQTEAFKAGEFDFVQIFSARQWARTFTGRKFDSGQIVKRAVPNRNAADFQGIVFNTRRDKFKDVRVREALEATMDYEWMNRQLFYNSYTRVQSYFAGGDFEAKGLPGPDELALLEPFRDKLPKEVFTQPAPLAPTTAAPSSLRKNLLRARDLLAAAGWTYRDGALRNAKGEAFTIEFLEAQSQADAAQKILAPMQQNLAKLGIQASIRIMDAAIYQKRMETFDFDMASLRVPSTEAPGQDLQDMFSSQTAHTEGSGNYGGVADPVIDILVNRAIAARTRPDLVTTLRALDRVLRHGHYSIPEWYANNFRLAWQNHKFGQPATLPTYYQAEVWATTTWWALPKHQ